MRLVVGVDSYGGMGLLSELLGSEESSVIDWYKESLGRNTVVVCDKYFNGGKYDLVLEGKEVEVIECGSNVTGFLRGYKDDDIVLLGCNCLLENLEDRVSEYYVVEYDGVFKSETYIKDVNLKEFTLECVEDLSTREVTGVFKRYKRD